MDWYIYPLIVLAGLVAGFINTLAGSGSLITLPMLIALGLPATVANGTNRIGILFQNIVGVGSFRQQKVLDFKSSVKLVIPSVIGSLVGAMIAVDINEKAMERAIGGLLLFMFFIILWKPSQWLREHQENASLPYWLRAIIFFFIGVYGGFIQAGVGFFLLAGLVLSAGYNLVSANAVKMFINLVFTLFALAVFIYHDQVNYTYGFILAGGNMMGAYLGTRVAVKWGPKFVRYLLLMVIIVASAKLLGLF